MSRVLASALATVSHTAHRSDDPQLPPGAATLTSMALPPSSGTGGSASTGTSTLPEPTDWAEVQLPIGHPARVQVPASAMIRARRSSPALPIAV